MLPTGHRPLWGLLGRVLCDTGRAQPASAQHSPATRSPGSGWPQGEGSGALAAVRWADGRPCRRGKHADHSQKRKRERGGQRGQPTSTWEAALRQNQQVEMPSGPGGENPRSRLAPAVPGPRATPPLPLGLLSSVMIYLVVTNATGARVHQPSRPAPPPEPRSPEPPVLSRGSRPSRTRSGLRGGP